MLPALVQHPLTSAGERPAPRGPRTPSHGAGSREPGSALLWPPRPRCSSGPPGPSADAHRPVRARPEGGASGCGWPRPKEVPERKDALQQSPTPTPTNPGSGPFLSLQIDTRTSDGESEMRDHWARTLVINSLESPSLRPSNYPLSSLVLYFSSLPPENRESKVSKRSFWWAWWCRPLSLHPT